MTEPTNDWDHIGDNPQAGDVEAHHLADAPEDDEPLMNVGDVAPDDNQVLADDYAPDGGNLPEAAPDGTDG